jgi:hypothetical protein
MSEEIKAAWQAILAAGILGGVLGALLTVVLNHWLTGWRDRRSGIKAEKSKFIPLIDSAILGTSKGQVLRMLFYDARRKMFEPAMRFRLHLKKRRLAEFNAIWEKFYNTTNTEVEDRQPNHSDEEARKMQQTLMDRLQALRKIVHES